MISQSGSVFEQDGPCKLHAHGESGIIFHSLSAHEIFHSLSARQGVVAGEIVDLHDSLVVSGDPMPPDHQDLVPAVDHVHDSTANSIQDGNGDDDETDPHVPTDDGSYGAGHFIYEDDERTTMLKRETLPCRWSQPQVTNKTCFCRLILRIA